MEDVTRRQAIKLAAIATGGVAMGGRQARAQEPKVAGQAKLVLRDNILWERCFSERILGRRVEVCAKVIERDGKFYLRIDGVGEYELVNSETEVEFGPFKLKFKISEVAVAGGRLNAVRLKVQACIGGTCRTLFNERIAFNYAAEFRNYQNLMTENSGLSYSYESDAKSE